MTTAQAIWTVRGHLLEVAQAIENGEKMKASQEAKGG